MTDTIKAFSISKERIATEAPSTTALFQTSLLLTALPLRHVIIACHFRVTAPSAHVDLAFSPSGVNVEVN